MQSILSFLIPRLAWAYLHLVGKTSRIAWLHKDRRYALEKKEGNFIYAFWHGRQVFIAYAYRNLPVTALVSQSKDGEYIAKVIELFGEGTVRGSSSRGGLRSLVNLKKEIDSGRTVGLTPDGPRGPQRSIAEGILFLAQKTGKPILPLTYSAKRKLIFHGWDDYWIPLPFNQIILSCGKPVRVSSNDSFQEKAKELRGSLDETTEEADRAAQNGQSVLESTLYMVYNVFIAIFSPLLLAGIFLRYPKTFLNHFADGLKERLAFFSENEAENFTHPLWVHAASLGECRAALPFIKKLREKHSGESILFTSTTPNGIQEARRLGLGDWVRYAPIDCPWTVGRFLNRVKPKMLLLLESELWPNWLAQAKAHGIPVGIINGRMSARSAARYGRFNFFSRFIFKKIDFAAVREQNDLDRFVDCGLNGDAVIVSGNMKYDLAPWELNGRNSPDAVSSAESPARVWTAGSVRDGEEKLILETHKNLLDAFPDLKLVIAPRHLEKMESLLETVESMNLEFIRRSDSANRSDWKVLIWDTFGDLWKAYEMADVVFIGGSLVQKGGQNPIEPAWFKKPILFGPAMENFEQPSRALLAKNGAVQVNDRSELESEISNLLKNPDRAKQLGDNAKMALDQFTGRATLETISLVERYLHS